MPRYFFNISDDTKYHADKQGVEVSGRHELLLELKRLIALLPERLRRSGTRVLVMDISGSIIAEEWVMTPAVDGVTAGPVSAPSMLPANRGQQRSLN
jgi:hypothetical protein